MRVRASLLVAVAALLLCASPASAAIFNVNTTADNGTCNAVTCSLRGAIGAANKAPGSTINVPANNYTLNLQANGQLPSITTDMTITGASAATTTIRGDGKNGRIFTVSTVNGHARISHLRMTFTSVVSLTTAADRIGGGILVDVGATLDLDHSRIDNGTADRGGGMAIRGGTAHITKSSIDTNTASFQAGNLPTADAAGILVLGLPSAGAPGAAAHLTLTDSTVAKNTTTSHAGIESTGNPGNSVTITRSTVAFNDGGASGGNGIFLAASSGSMIVSGSIVAGNTGDNPTPPDNCGGGITNGGGTVEDGTGCGFTRQVANVSQLVSSTLTAAGETVVLALPASSIAIDLAGACTGADQRDLPRPQGAACDAGAYEVDQPFTSEIDSGPSGVVTGSTASFTFSASEPGVTFQCRLDGPQGPGAFGGCVSPTNFGALAAGAYTFTLQAADAGGHVVTSSRSFTVAAVQQATPTPTPVVNKSVVIQPLSGKVTVKLPGKKTFEPVDVTIGIPNGSTVDTTKGKIRLFAIPKAGKPVESALFYDGIFKLKLSGGITELQLTEELAKCPSGKASAGAAAKKKPKTRKLWGDGSGSFRTRGQYSAATVRGTKWLVQDSCGKTLTRVAKGVVSVNDFVRHKTILLRAPHRYTARKKH
jgi:CSLREA domain-containing protein